MIQLYAILDCDHKTMNNLPLPQKDREKEIDCLAILRTVFKLPEYHKTRLKEDLDDLKSNPGLNLTYQ